MPRRSADPGAIRYLGLDLIRSVGISIILLSHIFSSARYLHLVGVVGVDLFFVLSGFLIGGMFLKDLQSRPHSNFADLYSFLRRRWYRTLPNYFLFFALNWVAAVVTHHNLPAEPWKYLLFLQNFFKPVLSTSFYAVSWSLSVEEWFYLLLPALAIVFSWRVRSKFLALALACGCIIAVSIVGRLAVGGHHPWEATRMVTALRLDAICYGVLIALIKYRWRSVFVAMRRVALPGAAILAASVWYLGSHMDQQSGRPTLIGLTIVPIMCAVLLPAFARLSSRNRLFVGVATSMSQWSYSMYLSHTPILFLLEMTGWQRPVVGAVMVVLCLCVSAVTFEYFELPLMRLRDRPSLLLQAHANWSGGAAASEAKS